MCIFLEICILSCLGYKVTFLVDGDGVFIGTFHDLCCTRHRGGLKKLLNLWKEHISGILFFNGDIICLRSRHLVLRLLGTLTGQ